MCIHSCVCVRQQLATFSQAHTHTHAHTVSHIDKAPPTHHQNSLDQHQKTHTHTQTHAFVLTEVSKIDKILHERQDGEIVLDSPAHTHTHPHPYPHPHAQPVPNSLWSSLKVSLSHVLYLCLCCRFVPYTHPLSSAYLRSLSLSLSTCVCFCVSICLS